MASEPKNKTEYRACFAKAQDPFGFGAGIEKEQFYLQFKSTQEKRNFPDFWNFHQKQVWRYIPNEFGAEYGFFGDYISELKCPTSMPDCNDAELLVREEKDQKDNLNYIPRMFPDIQDYFVHLNELITEKIKKDERESQLVQTLRETPIVPL
jgi:hypothetical protein